MEEELKFPISDNEMDNELNKRFNTLNTRITELETKISSVEHLKAIKDQIQTLALMNENFNLKLDNFNHKAKDQDNATKGLTEEIKALKITDKEFSNTFKELKMSHENFMSKLESMNERLMALVVKSKTKEDNVKKDIIKIEGYITKKIPNILVSIDNGNSFEMVKRILKKRKEKFKDIELNENTNQIKIFDIDLYSRNISILIEKCSNIKFNDVDVIDINEHVEITNNVSIECFPESILNFKHRCKININNAHLKMKNVHIIECKYEDNYLIDIQAGSSLEMNNGYIERNYGNRPILHVNTNGTLNLNDIVFRRNVQFKKENIPSCIKSENKGNININKCEFLDHSSRKWPYSAYIIEAKGDLNIKSSNFENNKEQTIKQFRSIIGYSDRGKINMENITFKNNTCMKFGNYNSINIRNSHFHNNNMKEGDGGCIQTHKSSNIKIEGCEFKGNVSTWDGGAVYIWTSKGENLIKNCLFSGNSATGLENGGGGAIVFNTDTNFTISNSKFVRNKSVECNGGAIAVYNCGSKITCNGCTFERNAAKKKGGAIFVPHKNELIQLSPSAFILNVASSDNDVFY